MLKNEREVHHAAGASDFHEDEIPLFVARVREREKAALLLRFLRTKSRSQSHYALAEAWAPCPESHSQNSKWTHPDCAHCRMHGENNVRALAATSRVLLQQVASAAKTEHLCARGSGDATA